MSRLFKYLVWCAVWTALGGYSTAAPVTFQFATTIDARSKGLGEYTDLSVVYTFDTGASAGTGPFGSTANADSYGLTSLSISIGGQTVNGTGGGITVFNDVVINYTNFTVTQDSYDVRAQNYLGTLFGATVTFFRFLLVDMDYDMVSGSDLPDSPNFSVNADFQQLEIQLSDSSVLGIQEFEDTPENLLRPFSLTAIPEPSSIAMILSMVVLGAAFSRRRFARAAKAG